MTRDLDISRRMVLRGSLNAAAVTVALPFLDSMFDVNGEAYAATNTTLPTIFGTWFYGLGLAPGFWQPSATGANFPLTPQLELFAPVKDKMNVYSGMQVFLDGKVNQNHYSSAQGIMTGYVAPTGAGYSTSLDQAILAKLQPTTRFRSIEVACDGDTKSSWSARGDSGMNPSIVSPASLYGRIFGPEFVNPNAANFKPDTKTMVRHSALSAITEQRKKLVTMVGADDRAKLDEYFTSVRDLEKKLSFELQRPAPLEACTVAGRPEGEKEGTVIEDAMHRHNLFIDLLTHALACGQTRVFNLSISQGMSGLRKAGDPTGHHTYTHEEPIDPVLGYQKMSRWFSDQNMAAFLYVIQSLDNVKEGDRTLLDRSLVFAYTDHGEARLHSMKEFPLFTAGSANGRLRTGYHVNAKGDTVSRLPLTIQHALGISVDSWGRESNMTSKPFTELLV
ncbi:DUF1552 domain-containing protein [Sphingopyxis sp. USTB-05]|uniref:DUF1552 domain-containing protein n=1 Tax=Sphingopyxis sp. USTB-05 TaxID=2830667 RepID=UPI0020788159|nr:DUF1552 domain-containing protein [Sphingopyxis sp. USTB-05]USI77613.1 DUF1552 domain-containing protein [Sphingopyxis sp. USTB-05]